jgi:hypothetical protein
MRPAATLSGIKINSLENNQQELDRMKLQAAKSRYPQVARTEVMRIPRNLLEELQSAGQHAATTPLSHR